MSIRTRFCDVGLAQLNRPVVWGARGPEAFDCSGHFTWCLRGVGGPDLRATHTAFLLSEEMRRLLPSETPLPGDACFYGPANGGVIHVAIWLAADKILSADGATSSVLDLATARANPLARVRLHDKPTFRSGFRGVYRNHYLDAMENVAR